MKLKLHKLWKNVVRSFKKNEQTIYLAGSLALGCTALIATAVNAPKAKEVIENEKAKEDFSNLSKGKKILRIAKISSKYYTGPILLAVGSAALSIASYKSGAKKLATALGTLGATQARLNDIQSAIVEEVGEKKAKDIINNANTQPAKQSEEAKAILDDGDLSGDGLHWFMDYGSKKLFRSCINDIRNAQIMLVKRSQFEEFTPLSELYSEIGVDDLIPDWDEKGWNMGDDIQIDFGCWNNPNGIAVTVLKTNCRHRDDYRILE